MFVAVQRRLSIFIARSLFYNKHSLRTFFFRPIVTLRMSEQLNLEEQKMESFSTQAPTEEEAPVAQEESSKKKKKNKKKKEKKEGEVKFVYILPFEPFFPYLMVAPIIFSSCSFFSI